MAVSAEVFFLSTGRKKCKKWLLEVSQVGLWVREVLLEKQTNCFSVSFKVELEKQLYCPFHGFLL